MQIVYGVGDKIACTLPGTEEVLELEVKDVDVESVNDDLEFVYTVEHLGQPYSIGKNNLKSTTNPDTLHFLKDLKPKESYDLLGWRDGLELRPDNSNMPEIVTLLMAIQYDKEGHYGSSWKGKGEYRGIMSNIDRKYDRLDQMTVSELEGKVETLKQLENKLEMKKNNTGNTFDHGIGESKIDAVADLANYSILYLTYIQENYPLVFRVWVDRNLPKYLADKIGFLSSGHQK